VSTAPVLPSDDVRVRRAGYLVLLATVGVFVGWSVIAPLDSAAVAPGVVIVEGYRKSLQHLEGGIVKAIHVRDGDAVQPGQLLLELDDTRARADLEVVRGQYHALRAREARLVAERDGTAEPEFPPEFLVSGDPDLRDAVEGQRRLFRERRRSLDGERAVLEQRIGQLEEQIHGLQGVQTAKGRAVESYRVEIADLKKLFERGMGDRQRLRELERAAAELEGEQAEHAAAASAARVQVSETRLQILQLEQRFRTELVGELREAQDRSSGLKERIRALEDTLTRTRIVAPVAGTVVGLALHTVGGVVPAGGRLLDLVPAGVDLVVEAQVQPGDISRVYAGLPAHVRFTALKSRTTPVVDGVVETVSADRITDPAAHLSYFLARVRVSREALGVLGGKPLLPGMPAEVMIRTGERTLAEYLIKPLTDGFARAFREE
jgi:epimerase transport system membrane fusion protein